MKNTFIMKLILIIFFSVAASSFPLLNSAASHSNQLISSSLADTIVLASITPNQTTKGKAPSKIVIKGAGFVKGAKVFFNLTEVASKFRSTNKIIIKQPPAELFQTDKTYDVKVVLPDGKTSDILKFVVGTGIEPTPVASIVITGSPLLTINAGSTSSIQAKALDKDGNEIPDVVITFQSDSSDVASVSDKGVVTGISGGAATIQIKAEEVSKQLTFTVNTVSSEPSGIFGNSDLEIQGSTGTLFASDFLKHVVKIRRVLQPMVDYTGKSGTSGNSDGMPAAALFNAPLGIGIGRNIYLADTNNQSVRQVSTTTGEVKTLFSLSEVKTFAPSISSWGPRDITIDSNEDMYITDAVNHVIWQASVSGSSKNLRVLAGEIGKSGFQNGTGSAAKFNTPQKITLVGNILNVTESSTFVRQVSLPSGEVKSIGSTGTPITTIRTEAVEVNNEKISELETNEITPIQFTKPTAITSDSAGNLYVADNGNIKKITITNGNISSIDLTPSGTLKDPVGVVATDDSVYVLDASNGLLVQIKSGAPTITNITPSETSVGKDGTTVSVKGSNFLPDTQVIVGTQTISNITIVNSKELQFILPPQEFGGTFPVIVRNRGGIAKSTFNVIGLPKPASVALSSFPSIRSIAAGQITNFTIFLNRTNFTGSVDLSINGLPTGATAKFDPIQVTDNLSLLTITTPENLPPAKYPLRISGIASGLMILPIDITLDVSPGPNNSKVVLSVDPLTQTITPGQSTSYFVNIARTEFTGNVTLSTSGVPSGVSAVFNPSTTSGNSSVLTLQTISQLTPGTYKFTINASAQDAKVTPVQATLIVNVPPPPSTVRLFITPSLQTITQGQSASYNISLSRSNYNLAVELRLLLVPGSPFDQTIKPIFSPNSVTGNSATLTMETLTTTQPGTYRFVVTGRAIGANIFESGEFVLSVNAIPPPPPPSVKLSIIPNAQTVQVGKSTSFGIGVNAVNYSKSVTFSVSGAIPDGSFFTFNPPTCVTFPCNVTLIIDTSVLFRDGDKKNTLFPSFNNEIRTPPGVYNMQVEGIGTEVKIDPVPFTLTVQP